MNKLKHTPGPWESCGDGDCGCGFIYGEDYIIARAKYDYDDIILNSETVRANSLLIAAAPDLLDDKIKDFNGIGKWLSAALEDSNVCEEMKHDIKEWFDRFKTFEKATGLKIEEVLK